jgi:hypothetical protein
MTESNHDTGVLMALLQRLKKRRIPNALALKEKVDRGLTLSEYDKKFMERVSSDLRKAQTIVSRHPEYQPLVDRMAFLYQEISDKALENEKGTG